MAFKNRIQIMSKLAVRNVWLNARHSLATILAISIGFAAVSLFDGFMAHIKTFIVDSYVHRGMLGHVEIEKIRPKDKQFEDPWKFSIDENEQEMIQQTLKQDDRVQTWSRYLVISGVVSNAGNPLFVGIGYDVQEGMRFRGDRWAWNTLAGVPLHLANGESALLGKGLAKRMNCKFDEKNAIADDGTYIPSPRAFSCPSSFIQLSGTTEQVQINAIDLKAVGAVDMILRDYNDRFVIMPLPAAQKLMDTKKIGRISVLLKDPSQEENFIEDLKKKFKEKNADFEVVSWWKHSSAAAAKGGMEILDIFRNLFLTVVVVVAAMSVANTMSKSINERIREIGMFRSVGFRQGDIIAMFLFEGLLLGLVSCLVGVALTIGATGLIAISGITFNTGILSSSMPLRIYLSPITLFSTLILLCLITAGTSWFISRKAARMVVADSLRHVA